MAAALTAALALAMLLFSIPAFAAGEPSEPNVTGSIPDTRPVMSVHDANEHTTGLATQSEPLPSSYSSVDEGKVTSVKNQDEFGTCWTFALCAAAESAVLANGAASDPDISERHLAYFTYHPAADPLGNTAGDVTTPTGTDFAVDDAQDISDRYLVSGGNARMAALTWASWRGAAPESAAPYDELLDAYFDLGSTDEFYQLTALDSSLAQKDHVHGLLDRGSAETGQSRGGLQVLHCRDAFA